MEARPSNEVPVLIVGAGPAGLVAAIALARYGVGSLLVERRAGTSPLPRATGISTRTMEIIRSWGLEGDVRAGALDVEPRAWLTETLASPHGVPVSEGWPSSAEASMLSPTAPAIAPQDHLEPVLLDHLESLGLTEIRLGTELASLETTPDGVTALLREPRGGASTVRSRYVIGADGAHSRVRSSLGITMRGPDDLMHIVTTLFHAPLKGVLGDRRYAIYFIRHPAAGGVLVPCGIDDRWIYGRPWDPRTELNEDYTHERLVELIRTAVGDDTVEPEIVRTGSFSFAAQVADGYRRGPAFLVGDAAHRMTPRGGTGMNTAIHDAYDLGWKLAWVVKGWASEDLLDTFETERRPVGVRRTARSAQEGATRPVLDELTEDLGGRIAHAWVHRRTGAVSTLDLIGPGLTLLIGPEGAGWRDASASLEAVVPTVTHALDEGAAEVLGLSRTGAVLVRPDGRPIALWPALPIDPRARLEQALSSLPGVSKTGPPRRGVALRVTATRVGSAVAAAAPLIAASLPFAPLLMTAQRHQAARTGEV